MINKTFITKSNIEKVDIFIKKPAHALLIIGAKGAVKLDYAKYIASEILGLDEEKLGIYPFFNVVSPVNNLIGIDQIREIKQIFKLKTTGKSNSRRVLIIEDAENMNKESQNAILKLLEEPPADSLIILTASDKRQLLPTITSRLQTIKINKPTLDEALQIFKEEYSEDDIKKWYLFSDGSLSLMKDLLEINQDNHLIDIINESKVIINSDKFNKLIFAEKISKDKDNLHNYFFAFKRLFQVLLNHSIHSNKSKDISKYVSYLNEIDVAENQFNSGINSKLLLTKLLLKI